MGGRADLYGAEDRPLHLLRHQVEATLGPGRPGRHYRPGAPGPVGEELLRLRPPQTVEGGQAS